MSALAQGIRGIAEIIYHAPGQAVRTYRMLPPTDRAAVAAAVRRKIGLGAYQEDRVTWALPYIVGGVVAVIAYNIFLRGKL